MASAVPLLVTVNRVVNLIALTYGLIFVSTLSIPSLHPNGKFAGGAKFFTNWNVLFHIVFYASCLYKQMFSRVKFDSRATTKRGLVYHAIVFPSSIIVFTTFWGLFAIDRNLIFPKQLEEFLLPHVNHIVHTLILPGMLIEGAFYHHPRPKKTSGMVTFFGVLGTYTVWICYIGFAKGFWVYPFLSVMPLAAKFVFFAANAVVGFAIYKLGGQFYKIFWAKSPSKLKSAKLN